MSNLTDLLTPDSPEVVERRAREDETRAAIAARKLGAAQADAWRECGQKMTTPSADAARKALVSERGLTPEPYEPSAREVEEYLAGWNEEMGALLEGWNEVAVLNGVRVSVLVEDGQPARVSAVWPAGRENHVDVESVLARFGLTLDGGWSDASGERNDGRMESVARVRKA